MKRHCCRLLMPRSIRKRILNATHRRCLCAGNGDEVGLLWNAYRIAKEAASAQVDSVKPIEEKMVFANNELDLAKIHVYGFDYDYTLAVYTKQLNNLIYDMALHRLIREYKYPIELTDIPYDPDFAIRGLHFDVSNCVLMKLDTFAQIQPGTVYRGKRPLDNNELHAMYHSLSVPIDSLNPSPSSTEPRFKQLLDLFTLPEVGLLATAAEYFQANNLEFDTMSLFNDVEGAVRSVHVSGDLYAAVNNNLSTYVHRDTGMSDFLKRLHNSGKELFLISNSPYPFIDTGMCYLIGPKWRDLFNHVIVKARKPRFFQDSHIPFRQYIASVDQLSYQCVKELKQGTVYAGGNIFHLEQMAGLKSKGVLYFGDHIYSDLADPMLLLGWYTGAIVPELQGEIKIQNSRPYVEALLWLRALTTLIGEMQDQALLNDDTAAVLHQWFHERNAVRNRMKSMFNPQFGSIFRTFQNPSYFSRRLMRLSNIYTSRLANLNQYGLNYTFYPKRSPLPHDAAADGSFA